MTQQVTFSDCLNVGIRIAGVGVLFGGAFGRSLPMIVSNGLGNLVGITAGNYIVHNTETCKKFDRSTKSIIVIALSVLVSSTVFGGFALIDRNLSVSKFVQSQFGSSLLCYFFDWGIIEPKPSTI